MKFGKIYLITNDVNSKVYVGQTIQTLNKRFNGHCCYSKSDRSVNMYIKRAIHKYGKDKFHITLIEECPINLLNDREKYWISHYDAVNSDNFYNLALGGDGGNTLVGYTSEQLREHSKILSKSLKGVINQGENNPRSKKVICLNNMQIFNTTVDASRYAEVSDVSIQSCCNGKTYTSGIDKITGEKLQWEYYTQIA